MIRKSLAGVLAVLLVWVSIASIERTARIDGSDAVAMVDPGANAGVGSVDDHHLDDQGAQRLTGAGHDPFDGACGDLRPLGQVSPSAIRASTGAIFGGRAEPDPPFRPPRASA